MGTKTNSVTCRYGVTYTVTFKGSAGEIARSFDLMSNCCCWVCHNRECTEPRDEILPECGRICEIWTKVPYCQGKLLTDIITKNNA